MWRSARLPPPFERLDDDHASAAARAWWADVVRFARDVAIGRRSDVQQFAGACDAGLAGGTSEQAVMPDAVEAARQHVEQEAADVLWGRSVGRAAKKRGEARGERSPAVCGSPNRRREIWSLGIGARGLILAQRQSEAQTWLETCLDRVEEERWVAFRPWPVALLCEAKLREQADPADLRPSLEKAFALSCQLDDPCWEGAVARAMALTYISQSAFPPAQAWLADGLKRGGRLANKYVALEVEILLNQAETLLRIGQPAEADAVSRKLLALAARTHMDAHITRATDLIAAARGAAG